MNCRKCGNIFPVSIVIDGKLKNLNKRKFCLQCSPYKQHNTRSLDIINTDKKTCPKCETEKTCDNFYPRKDGRLYSYCIECSAKQKLERTQKIKQLCVDYKGGKCQSCGYDKYIGALEFHHIDRNDKLFEISSKLIGNLDGLKPELDKCVLVCNRCHREIEGNIRECPQI